MPGPFDAPNVNWQAITDIPLMWEAGKKQRQEQDILAARKKALSNGVLDPQAAVEELLAIGDLEGASKAATVAKALQPDGMTPYQSESLDIQRQRLAQEDNPTAGAKAPSGYRWSETTPGQLEAIEGGPATRIPAETAGRVAMIDTALSDFDNAREVMQGQWGLEGSAESVIGMGDIGRAQRQVKSLIEAALRAMTGAAAPETEVARYMDLYMPNATDTAETAKQKLDLLTGFAHNAKHIITQGRGATTVPKGAAPPPHARGPSVEADAGGSRPISQGPLALPRAKSGLKAGEVYNFPDGRQGLWNGAEFEVLN